MADEFDDEGLPPIETYNTPSLARDGGASIPIPGGGQLVSERTLFGDVVMAQPTKAPRDEAKILRKIDTMAGAAGENWFYRFPVKKKGGGIDYIEGPSIDAADAVSRYYGNCKVDCAVVDAGPAWVIYSRFTDFETGYTLIRPFLQSKAGSRLGGEDDERRLQIALAIGTSKSQRNVIVHALRDFTDRAFEGAKRNLVARIGGKLDEYRQRCARRIAEFGPEMLPRVERVYGRKVMDWLAPDLARIIAEIRSINDGMASVDDTWPPPEPKRSDQIAVDRDQPAAEGKEAPATGAAATASTPLPSTAAGPMAAAGSEPPPSGSATDG
jgi:hypothetical protein